MGKFDEKRQLEHFLRDRFGAIILFGFRTKFPLLPSPCNPHNMAPRFAKRIASTRYGLGWVGDGEDSDSEAAEDQEDRLIVDGYVMVCHVSKYSTT